MAQYIIRRLLQAIPVLFGITLVVYAILLAAPGGPTAKFAQNPRMTEADRERIKKAWGLDQPVPIQYCRWMGFCNPDVDGYSLSMFISNDGVPHFLPGFLGGGSNGIIHGDLGTSLETAEPVSKRIGMALLPTLILAGAAFIIWVGLALILGVASAVRRNSVFDQTTSVFCYIGFAMPTFWLGLMLIYAFAGPGLDILPAQGMVTTRHWPAFGTDPYWAAAAKDPMGAFIDVSRHLVLPVVALVVVSIAGDTRFVRSSMLEALSQDYVRTAKAKGLSQRTVDYRHALRNALLPVITNIGLEIPFLVTGAIVTETIFNWPGIGRLTITATTAFDYPMLMGLLLLTAIATVGANLLADIGYAVVDPRIKY